jgi:hypothetical protein
LLARILTTNSKWIVEVNLRGTSYFQVIKFDSIKNGCPRATLRNQTGA